MLARRETPRYGEASEVALATLLQLLASHIDVVVFFVLGLAAFIQLLTAITSLNR